MKKVPSERESSFERLLRDTLRARAPKVSDTGNAEGCLDAETLAAWAEGTLSRHDRTAAEAHAADCARCQALLAAMVRTTPVAVEAPWWRVHMMAWMVPVSAAAAALVVWIVLPIRPANGPPANAAQVAQAQPASPAVALVVPDKEEPARQQKTDASRDGRDKTTSSDQVGGQRAEFRRSDAAEKKLAGSALAKAEASSARTDANDTSERRAQALADSVANVRTTPATPAPTTAAPPPAAAAPPPPAPSPMPAQPATPPAAAAPPPPASPPEAAPKTAAAAQEAASAMAARAALGRQRAADQIVALEGAAAPMVQILSPNPLNRWRLLAGGGVQRSNDGGSTWQTQQTGVTGVTAALAAGASPSPLVCWVVGSRGRVLLSTDGATWKQVSLSPPLDLVSIRATDDKNAVVTASDGRSFSTVDGGATWRPR